MTTAKEKPVTAVTGADGLEGGGDGRREGRLSPIVPRYYRYLETILRVAGFGRNEHTLSFVTAVTFVSIANFASCWLWISIAHL